MKQTHTSNHYVPEQYLKNWIGSSGKLNVYKIVVEDDRVPCWCLRYPSGIANQDHLYTQHLNGKLDDQFENWFNEEFETPAKVAITKVINEERLTKNDWRNLARFLAAQDVRTPIRLIEHLERQSNYQETLENVLHELKEDLENNRIKERNDSNSKHHSNYNLPIRVLIDKDIDSENTTISVDGYLGRSSWLFQIKHLLTRTIKTLESHRWTIVKPAKGYSWFTSDNPVVKLNFVNYAEYDLGGGWGRAKGNIFFPLDPQHAMFVQIGDNKNYPKGTRLPIRETEFLRRVCAENAHRMIFSDHEDNRIPFLRKRIINKDMLFKEKTAFEEWHKTNSSLEEEYLRNKP